MDEKYDIPLNPEYNPEIRKIQDTDPARASTIINPVLSQMIENTAAVKRDLDDARTDIDHLTDTVDTVEQMAKTVKETADEALGIAQDAIAREVSGRFTAIIPVAGWTTVNNIAKVTVAVNGMDASCTPIVGLMPDADLTKAVSQAEAYRLISDIETGSGNITVYSYSGKIPATEMPIQMLVVN